MRCDYRVFCICPILQEVIVPEVSMGFGGGDATTGVRAGGELDEEGFWASGDGFLVLLLVAAAMVWTPTEH